MRPEIRAQLESKYGPAPEPFLESLPTPEPQPAVEASEAWLNSVQPTGNRVLCRSMPHIRQVGRILMVGGKTPDIVVSRVVARGPEIKARPWDLAAGDYVLHIRVAGVRYDGILGSVGRQAQTREGSLIFLLEDEILGIVDPAVVETLTGEMVAPRYGSTALNSK